MTAAQFGQAFLAALASGDAATLAPFYADEITLESGSELLKSRWGLSKTRDRNEAETHPKAALLGAYETFFAKVRAKWVPFFEAMSDDRWSIIEDAGMTTLEIKKTDSGDDRWLFRLRETDTGWAIFSEWTDY